MGTGSLAEQMIAHNLRPPGMVIDNGFRQDTAVQRMTLAHHPVFDHHDGCVPAALAQRLLPFRQPFTHVQRHGHAGKLGLERVSDDIEGQGTFAARDSDLERPSRAGPTVQGDLNGFFRFFCIGHESHHASLINVLTG